MEIPCVLEAVCLYLRPLRTSLSNNTLQEHQPLAFESCTTWPVFSAYQILRKFIDENGEDPLDLLNWFQWCFIKVELSWIYFYFFTLSQNNIGHCTFFLWLLRYLLDSTNVYSSPQKRFRKKPTRVRHIEETCTDSPLKCWHSKFLQNRLGNVLKQTGEYP